MLVKMGERFWRGVMGEGAPLEVCEVDMLLVDPVLMNRGEGSDLMPGLTVTVAKRR